METNYDSTNETLKHVHKVRERITEIIRNLDDRQNNHDNSKFESPEKEAFDSLGPPELMAALTYGSEEYKANLRKLKPAIEHHYEANDHHPEHYKLWRCPLCKALWSESDTLLCCAGSLASDKRDPHFCPSCVPNGSMYEAQLEPETGIYGMSLMSLLEMLADWKAAGERHSNGSMTDSLAKNKDRFKISDQLQAILENTARELGWK